MKNLKYIFISISIILIDQFSKFLVRGYFSKESSPYFVEIIGKLVRFTHVENPGIAFGLRLSHPLYNRIIIGVITVLAIVFIWYLFKNAKSKFEKLTFSLILGGAVGNMIDRIFRGRVTDFIDVDFPNFIAQIWGADRWPVFNIADSAISIAFVLLIIDQFFLKKNTGGINE